VAETIIEVRELKKHYPVKSSFSFKRTRQSVKAVDGVTFQVQRGETLGIVGESGCGKSTLARLLNRLILPTEGEIKFKGEALAAMDKEAIRSFRKSVQMVFQNPYASLNPRRKVGQLIEEPLVIHKAGDKEFRKKRVRELLEIVGLNPRHAGRYPHEFSGGQRQRINIARALALQPEVIICDEPVSALDVSIQAQVLNLLKELQATFGLTYVFISHDLNVVRYFCDRIAVMYLGKIVEIGSWEEIYNNPRHPYTKALLSAVPKESPFTQKERLILSGDVPSPVNPPKGCRFHQRCPFAKEICKTTVPHLKEIKNHAGHKAACHFAE